MNQLNYGSRQIVRPLGRHERIPNLSTADLLHQEVRPFALYEPDPEPEQVVTTYLQSDSNMPNHYRRLKSHQCFAPHIETKSGCAKRVKRLPRSVRRSA
jgi:hypothetical protein